MKKVYIDPGHSISDPGAVGYEVERDLNEKVSAFQKEHLLANYECEVKVGDISINSVSKVAADANAWGADFLCSNHFNAGGGDGYEALVYSQKRVEMGKVFEKHVLAIGQNSRGVKLRPDLGVLRLSNMPAILNEGAFVDNLKDIQDWNEDHELKKLGIAYAEATAEYCELPKKVAANATKPAKPAVEAKKSVEEIAKQVIDGKWGNGDERKAKLTAAGYDYKAVQDKVNELLTGKKPVASKSVDQVAKEVIQGKWGNGAERKERLIAAGYDYNAVQKRVNQLSKR